MQNDSPVPHKNDTMGLGTCIRDRFGFLWRLPVLMRFLPGLLLFLLIQPVLADKISPLAHMPDWPALNGYQRTITHDEFAHLVNTVYSPDGGFWSFATLAPDKVTIYGDSSKRSPEFTLYFAPDAGAAKARPYAYRTHSVSSDPARPLEGIKIALDPGHIGGDWAQLEARYFKLDGDPPVMEAKLNMITCQILAERLQADGAQIVWAKHGYEPTTDERPDTLHREAIAALSPSNAASPASEEVFGLPVSHQRSNRGTLRYTENRIDEEAALLFYRSAEIRARGDLVNRAHPDLTICVHYNADDWGNPDHPALIGSSQLIIFVNGSYERSELAYEDTRYDMLRKLLDRDAVQEEKGCELVGRQMLNAFPYPPEKFAAYFAHQITDVPSVYTRDLLASRLYHGPVVYCEGPYMNARDAYYRIIAGDYLGQRTINGQSVPSIYRVYALAVERGVLAYFAKP
jgi:N-acetylmuramoyl-L-alanine amidase